MFNRWTTFTRRTDGPKLIWLERQLSENKIPYRRKGRSFYAPTIEVPKKHFNAAWAILEPVDNIPNDDPSWSTNNPYKTNMKHTTTTYEGPTCIHCYKPGHLGINCQHRPRNFTND